MPLQSGNNKILKDMSRRYTKELYEKKVKKIKSLMPDACIGGDVIVGFPGESKSDFKETYKFINNLSINYLHVFPYSERVNTRADIMKNKIPTNEKALRSKMLRILSDKKKRFFYDKNIGLKKSVLFEKGKKNDWVNGFTENYIKVKVPYNDNIIGKIKSVRLRKTTNDLTVIGDLI
ncbi:MAG: radical SAM protein, partial [Marinoscillum sp.]